MGTLVWSPLAAGPAHRPLPQGASRPTVTGPAIGFQHLSDERRLDAVEQLIPLADKAGMSLTHLAMAFAIAHPGVTSAIIGPRTMEHLDDLLAGAEVTLDDEILDQIDAIVPARHRRRAHSTWPTNRQRSRAEPAPPSSQRASSGLIGPK